MSVIETLLEGEDLSAEFKEKATLIVNTAIDESVATQVTEQVDAKVAELTEQHEAALADAIEEATAELTAKVSDFMTYAVNEWSSANAIAIESGLKVQIAESFLSGIRDLAEDHSVEIPEGADNIVEGLETQVSELSTKLDETIAGNVELKSQITEMERSAIIAKASADLTDTQAEKLAGMVESIEFASGEDFSSKVGTLVESYFPAAKVEKEDAEDKGVEGLNEEVVSDKEPTASYLSQLTKAATS